MKKILFILFSAVLLLGCSNNETKTSNNSANSKSQEIISIVDSMEKQLFQMNSAEELGNFHIAMLDSIKQYLIDNNDGVGLTVDDQDYQKIMERLNIYNQTFIASLSRYNREMELSPIDSENEDVITVIALMQTMEKRALTDPKKNDSDGSVK